MKRLLGFVIFCTLFLGGNTAGDFTPLRVHAQSAPTRAPSTEEQYTSKQNDGVALITAQIAYLQNNLNDPALKQKWGGDQDTRWTNYVLTNPQFVTLLTNSKQTFNTNFLAAKQQGANPDAAFSAAILSVIDLINSGSNNIIPKNNQLNLDRTTINANLNAPVNAIRDAAVASGDPVAIANAQATANQTAAARAAQTPTGKCTNLITSKFIDCIDVAVTWFIKNTILQLAGFLLWLTANMLNYSIQVGILGFSTWAPDTLYPIWTIIRQIVSLFVVFSGLWLGFMYIIGQGEQFKRYVPWIILFALFVNFSYPLTRSLIDVSNVISLNIYTSAVSSDALIGNSPLGTPGAIITSRLGLQGLLISATNSTTATKGVDMLKEIDSIPGALMAVIFVGYTAWIFFVATCIIVARTASLVFLIVASPLLFVDSVIPKLGDKAAEMRKIFFAQLVVAPVFMIMLALTLKFLDVFKSLSTSGLVGASAIGGGNSVVVFFNLLMMLIMLKIMITVTKDISGKAGEFATAQIGKVGGFALGAATAGTGLIARGTMGRAAGALRDSKWVTNNQDSFLGRHAYNMTNSVASSTFDVRNNSFVKTKMDKVGLGMGMGAKFNYEQSMENRNKDRMERYNRIQTRYKKDVYDPKTGELLHREGDAIQEGIKAAAKFRESQGRTVSGTGLTGALKKADRFVFNKSTLGAEFEKTNEKLNADDKKALDSKVSALTKDYTTNPETGRPATQKEKAKYLADIETQIQEAKKTDPQLSGIHGQSLVKSLKQMKDTEAKEADDFDKKVNNLLGQYINTEDNKKALFLSKQDEEVREAMKARLTDKAPKDKGVENYFDEEIKKYQAMKKADPTLEKKMKDLMEESDKIDPYNEVAMAAFHEKLEKDNLGDTFIAATAERDRNSALIAEGKEIPGVTQERSNSWAGQGNTNLPAYQRQAAAGGAPRTATSQMQTGTQPIAQQSSAAAAPQPAPQQYPQAEAPAQTPEPVAQPTQTTPAPTPNITQQSAPSTGGYGSSAPISHVTYETSINSIKNTSFSQTMRGRTSGGTPPTAPASTTTTAPTPQSPNGSAAANKTQSKEAA